MVDGTGDCARNHGRPAQGKCLQVRMEWKKGCEEVGAPFWEDVVKELIVVVLNVLEELPPALPHAIALGACTSNRFVSAGSCCSSAVSQETLAGGRGLIWKISFSWLGTTDKGERQGECQ